MGKDTVLPHHGDKIRGDAHDQQVEQWHQALERHPELLGIGLHKFESHPTAGEVVKRITAILPLGIEHRHSRRKFGLGKMVVADDDIHPFSGGISYLVDGLDTAVEGDQKGEAVVGRPVYPLERQAITLIVTVRDIKIDRRGKTLEKRIHERHGSGPVHIVVPIHKNLLP